MPDGPRIADAAVTSDGRIHVWVLGDADTPVRVYDPATDSWTLEPPSAIPGPIPFEGQLVDAWGYGDETEVATAGDGLIYATQGVAGPEFRLFAYDPVTRRWERDAAIEFDEFVFDMAAGSDGDLYLLVDRAVMRFDVETRTMHRGAATSTRYDAIATAGPGIFAVIDSLTGAAATYDAETDAWEAAWDVAPITLGGWAADLEGWRYARPAHGDRLVARDAADEYVDLVHPPGAIPGELVFSDGRLYLIGSGEVTAIFDRSGSPP